jgi:hypothetical protein
MVASSLTHLYVSKFLGGASSAIRACCDPQVPSAVADTLVLPNGVEQKVEAVLSSVEVGKADNLKLDSEGGTQATSTKSRYLKTTISMGIAAVSLEGDQDAKIANPVGNTSDRLIGGAGGFKLVGMIMGAAVKSRAFGYCMGAHGAGISVYTDFVARGREVVFPKDTAMDIGVAMRR